MSEIDEELLGDFLVESWEQVETLDQEFVRLETESEEANRVEGIFRVMHTLKGGAGFINLVKLESIAHEAESLLTLVWEGMVDVDQSLIDILLEAADAVKSILTHLENSLTEGDESYEDLIARLRSATVKPTQEPESTPSPAFETPSEMEEADEPDDPELTAMEQLQAELMSALETGKEEAPVETKVPKENGSENRPSAGKQIRVKVELLDKLMNLVGELVLSRNQLLQLSATSEGNGMELACQRINLVTSELQDHILQARMQPIGTILKKFPRLVRDLATQTGKGVKLALEGEETGLDRTILEAIKDPLTHILRNSIDHGIEFPEERLAQGKPEFGTIHIRAFHEGGQVTIEFQDDGKGVDLARVREKAVNRGLVSRQEAELLPDREVLNFLFHPGLSTAESVTNLSGRGVGMDVVKTSTESIGGTIDIQSTPGEGTVVRLRLPLTLAIVPALIVTCDDQRYAIPQVSLQAMVRLPNREMIESLYGGEVYRLRGELLPLLRLREPLGLSTRSETEETNVVVIRSDNLTFGLIVDEVKDTEEIVVKPLSKELKKLNLYAGATIMGDGRIALILDVAGLAEVSRLKVEEKRHLRQSRSNEGSDDHRGQSLLLFLLGENRYALPLSLVSRLEEIPIERMEVVSGRPLVHYCGELLPLIDLGYELNHTSSLDTKVLQVLVVSNNGRKLGLAVDSISDVVDQESPVQVSSSQFGLLGSAVIDERAVALVCLHSIITRTIPEWLDDTKPATINRRILMLGPSSMEGSFVRAHLETSGHRLESVTNPDAAIRALGQKHFDCVLWDMSLLSGASAATTANRVQRLPVLGFNPGAGGRSADGVTVSHARSPDQLQDELESLCSTLIGGAA